MKSAIHGLHGHSFSGNPILIVDRLGMIGERLSLKLSKEFLVVLVSQKKIELGVENKNVIHIPFFKKFPLIPDNKYSHIIFIDPQLQDLELLPKLTKKAKDINANFVFAQELSSRGEYAVEKVLGLYLSAKVVLFGDIFDNKLTLRKRNFTSVINKYIYQAQKFGRIQVLGEGLRESYPVFLHDVSDRIIDLVFGMHGSDSLFYIFPKHSPTELFLAHMIQKANPEIKVDFIGIDPRKEKIVYPTGGKYLLEERYPLAKKIRNIDIEKKAKEQDVDVVGEVKRLKSFPIFILWILLFLFFAPFVFSIFFSFLGFSAFNYAQRELNLGNNAGAKSSLHLSQTLFYVGERASNILYLQAKIFGQENRFEGLFGKIDTGRKISQGLFEGAESVTYFSKILKGESRDPSDDFTKGEKYLKDSIILLGKVRAEKKISAQIFQSMDKINPLINFLSDTTEIVPSLWGINDEKTYLVLLQNNMDLKPGGGSIGSYGILKLNRGEIVEFSLHDVRNADNQLRGHIEPPFALRRYLPVKHWYMKDSNFDVDFVKSASSSSNFLFVETGQKANGVIGVDLSFIKSLLHMMGSVRVSACNAIVNENNLSAVGESCLQKSASSGQPQDKDFFKILVEAIIEDIKGKKIPYPLIARVISDALTQKHLLIAFENRHQNIFTANGWSSSLWDERPDRGDAVNDFLGINETSLSLNSWESFIKRQISQNVSIEKNGDILEEINIIYKNENKNEDYRNYLRFILPQGTRLLDISIGGKSQKIVDAITDPLIYEAKNFKAPQGLEVEQEDEGGKTILGFLINVPAGKASNIGLKYVLSKSVSGMGLFSYSQKLFKQPGVDSIPYSFSLTCPNYLKVVGSSDGVIEGGDGVQYTEKIVEDKNFLITLAKEQ